MNSEPGASPAQGWYPAPEGDGRLRYWDGTTWTGDYTDGTHAAHPQRCAGCGQPLTGSGAFCVHCGTSRDTAAPQSNSAENDRRLQELTRAADAALPSDLPREGPLADRDWDDLCRWTDQIETARVAAAVLNQQARRVTHAKVAAIILRDYPTATEAFFGVEDVGDGSQRWAFAPPQLTLADGRRVDVPRVWEGEDGYDEEWDQLLTFELSEWATSRDSAFTLHVRTGEWKWIWQ